MRIAVTGASGVVGRGIVARLSSQGHDVVGLARHRPESWPSTVDFVQTDIRDATGVRRALARAEVVAHCAWTTRSPSSRPAEADEVNIGGTGNVLDAMAQTGTRRIVFASSAYAYGTRPVGAAPVTENDEATAGFAEGLHKARVEEMLAACDAQWVAIRSALILGRDVDNRMCRLLASPVFVDVDGSAERCVQVVHTDDVHRLFVRAILDTSLDSGRVNLAAPGEATLRAIAAATRRPVLRIPKGLLGAGGGRLRPFAGAVAEFELLQNVPPMDTSRLHGQWGFTPAWTATECVDDFALAIRGRVALGTWLVSLPWRLARIQRIPAVDSPAPDGTVPALAGPQGCNGEFDTPIDPRFPTFAATNLSEALPGPFSPSSVSVAVRGLRAGGVVIAERLRPGGLIQHEIATRTVAVFAHRLYGAITSAHFMAESMPFVKPATIIRNSGFFGPSVTALPIFAKRPLQTQSSWATTGVRAIRNIGVFGVNVVGLSAGSARDTHEFVADIDRLERLVGNDVTQLDERRLLGLILLARDHVVHGWTLASVAFMLCAAYNVLLSVLCGRDITFPAGSELVSARPLAAMHRLVDAAQRDPNVTALLAKPGGHLAALSVQAPDFHAAVLAELALIGHRGPAEVEMRSTSFADDPELLVRMVAKSLNTPAAPRPRYARIPLRARPVARQAARQVRDRESRRDRMVRGVWVLRGLLREHGRRLAESGVLESADDVFYLLVDELVALPANPRKLVARRHAEQRRLATIVPPTVFSGSWQSASPLATVLTVGERLQGLGVCGGRVRGRVRIVRPETIDELEPGEILVAEVTDVGYTAAFSYAAAVVTELGGPMSHAAVVAREFGFPCVVDAQGATRRLPPGALVEVDGTAGDIRVLELATDNAAQLPATDQFR